MRETERELNVGNIPMMISGITILFFRDDEIFNEINEGLKLSDNKKCITSVGRVAMVGTVTGYGMIEVPSRSDIKCKWTLKIKEKRSYSHVCIGIIDSTKSMDVRCIKPGAYLLGGCQNRLYQYDTCSKIPGWTSIHGKRYKDNDMISILLDLQKGTTDICINDKKQGIIQNIKTDDSIKYKLFVDLWGAPGTSVEIVNFLKF